MVIPFTPNVSRPERAADGGEARPLPPTVVDTVAAVAAEARVAHDPPSRQQPLLVSLA